MTFFTIEEFLNKYNQCQNAQQWQIEMACEMTYSEIELKIFLEKNIDVMKKLYNT